MEDLAEPALKAVLETQEIKLYPKKFENTYRHWMENVRDWNISRQLWWGQQIPAYYYGSEKHEYAVAETKEAALALAKQIVEIWRLHLKIYVKMKMPWILGSHPGYGQ